MDAKSTKSKSTKSDSPAEPVDVTLDSDEINNPHQTPHVHDDEWGLPREINVTMRPPPREISEITVRTVVRTLSDQVRFIALTFMLFVIVGIVAAFLYLHIFRTHTGVANAVVMFGFPEAEVGLDPLGNRLDVNRLRSPYVIGRALDELGLRERGISAEVVRGNLEMHAVVPFDALDRLIRIHEIAYHEPARLEEVEEVLYHPTMYTLQIFRRDALELLSSQEINELLNEIVRQYQAYFQQAYSEFYFLDVIAEHFDIMDYDYIEIVSILRNIVSRMLSYTASMREHAPDFRSPNSQMTFGDIWSNLDLIRVVEIHRVAAFVHANSMSRDRRRAIIILEYEIARKELDLAISRTNAESSLFLLQEVYRPQQWFSHYIRDFYAEWHVGDAYNRLLDINMTYERIANRLEAEIEFYSARLDNLRGAYAPANIQDIIFVEGAIPQIFDTLRVWEGRINQTVEDYLAMELFGDAVRLMSPSYFRNSLIAYRQQLMLIVVVTAAFGLLLGVMIVLYRDDKSLRSA